MTEVLLIRHAHVDAADGWLAGRAPGHALSARGRQEAHTLARRLAMTHALGAIYTSPLIRARETARAIADGQRASVRVCPDLQEIDYGRWTGRTFADLEREPAWRIFNARRSRAVIPEGESLAGAQRRAVATIARIALAHDGACVACVTHAEIVRLAVLAYARWSLDDHQRVVVPTASVTLIRLSGDAGVVALGLPLPVPCPP